MSQSNHNLAWFHCNNCHRAFEHHNTIENEDRMRITKSDLMFAFTACGHVLCGNCLQDGQLNPSNGQVNCPVCRLETDVYKLEGQVKY